MNKMYHFNPNNYGSEYFVIAKDKEMALRFLLKHFTFQIYNKNSKCSFKEQVASELREWEKVKIDNAETYPQKYTIDEHLCGDVVESEIS